MGFSPHRALPPLLACLLALALALALAAAAAPAGAVELGISDSDASTTTEPDWAGLHVRRVRIVVPWDVATTTGDAGTRRRENLERYLANASAVGASVLVAFAASVDVRAPGTNDAIAPTADQFAAGFAAFRAQYPDVTTFAAWNEPNNRTAHHYPLAADPRLAADYWLRAKAICPSACTLVAGDFAGIPGDDAFVDAYQSELAAAGAVPAVWAFHAHSDVNRYQVIGVSDARISRYYLSKLQGPWAGSRIWIDEVGARYRDADGIVWGDASQRDSTSLLLGLATLDPRIDAIYYYNYSNRCSRPSRCAVQDRGLVPPAPLDGQPPAYDAAGRRRAAYAVIANRGPAIAPVAALPPAVTIEKPAQGAALRTRTPAFAGRAATTIKTEPVVTLQLLPGSGEDERSAPAQTLTAPVVDGRWSVTAAALPDGVYTARAIQDGNPGTTGISEDLVFTVDTVAPSSSIVAGPGAVSGDRTPQIAFEASEPGATFRCSRDGRRFAPCASPLTPRRLRLGVHTFRVRATDAAGNVQPLPTRLRWRVVSLARALVPRLGGLAPMLAHGLPVSAACEDRCRVGARLDLSDRGTVARASARRRRAGRFGLRLRPRGAAAAALAHAGGGGAGVGLRLTLVLRVRGSRPLVVRRPVTLLRRGVPAALAAHGLPVTLACASACDASAGLWVPRSLARRLHARGRAVAGGRDGLPHGARYVRIARRAAHRREAGASELRLRLGGQPRRRLARAAAHTAGGVAIRVTAAAGGPGTDARALTWPLALGR